MAATALTLRSTRVVTPDGVHPADVHVRGEIIADVTPASSPASGTVLDVGDAVVSPGLVDIHVHVNEPGRTHWEGFATATRAAAAGGVTTVIDMPLNCIPPTVTAVALAAKRETAAGRCHVDVGFWGGIVPDNLDDLADLHAAGVFGFKAFLADSGVDEFGHVDEAQLEAAMRRLADLDALTLVHAEDADVIASAAGALDAGDPLAHATWLASRPDEAEARAVARVGRLAAATGGRAHVLHLSSATALAPLRDAARGGARITAETCPHYLTFTDETIPAGATPHKCAPPIRRAPNREQLWTALADGTIAVVASDHSPCPPDLKQTGTGDFVRAWGGIASLQLGLSAVWTGAADRGHVPIDVAEWMSSAPARLVGLGRKGALAPGNDADLVVWDPDETWVVDAAALEHRHPVTPYDGRELRGRVRSTWLRGRKIYDEGAVIGPPTGRLLHREEQ
jgi:allantoinase